LLDELRQAAEKGVLIINTTQCCHGTVSAIYETGAALLEAGVIPGADMTPEAALTKLSYVLSKDEWDLDTKRQMMMTSLRGELTVPQTMLVKDLELFEAVARSLHMSSSDEMDRLKDVLFPTLLCSAVKVLNFIIWLIEELISFYPPTFTDGRFGEIGIAPEIRRQFIGDGL
jgi:60kDa lysophospholipase